MTYSLGVDLGSTSLAAAVGRPDGTRMVPLGQRTDAAPAVLHVGEDGAVATGDVAEQRSVGRPDGTVREVRNRLGDDRPVRLPSASYPVTALLAAQLRHVVRHVVDAEGGAPERIVLTHPASWDAVHRARFDDVWAAAGIAAPLVVTEPEAAARHALAGRPAVGEIVAVYDLGGSFHGTILRRRRDGGLEILGTPEGDERVGGAAFDGAVLDHVADVVGGGAPIEIDGDDLRTAAALARLRQDCVLAKEALSREVETVVPLLLPGRQVEVRLTRATFEEMVRAPLGSTMRALARSIRSAGLISSDVGSVLLLGGSSRIPLVRQMLTQQFGRPLLDAVHPENVVALGAAQIGLARMERTQLAGARAGAAPAGRAVRGPAPVRSAVGYAPAPVPVLDAPRFVPGPPAVEPERRRSRRWLPLAAAALAASVLAGVFVLAPGGEPAPSPVPAGAPPSATGPATSGTPTSGPPTSGPPSSAGAVPPTASTSATSTTARPRRTATARPRATPSRTAQNRTTQTRTTQARPTTRRSAAR